MAGAAGSERGTNRVDLAGAARPYYNLMMFPYPSAEGLHVGNLYAFTGADIHGRFQRLRGHDVFEPIGFDAFGIHSENYALKVGIHPAELIPRNIANFRAPAAARRADGRLAHEVADHRPGLLPLDAVDLPAALQGRARGRKKRAAVNWCPACKTVLANEQVIDGYCERHPDTQVEQRTLEQWFFTITKYAERLLDNLDRIDWSRHDADGAAQLDRPLGGRGARLRAAGRPAASRVFTTRPDTLFGATYMVLAPEHPLVDALDHRGAPRRRGRVPAPAPPRWTS